MKKEKEGKEADQSKGKLLIRHMVKVLKQIIVNKGERRTLWTDKYIGIDYRK